MESAFEGIEVMSVRDFDKLADHIEILAPTPNAAINAIGRLGKTYSKRDSSSLRDFNEGLQKITKKSK